MKRKVSEDYLGNMMKHHGFKAEKSRDRGYVNCPHCHQAVKVCPHCKKDMLLQKAKTRLDYTVLMDWVEVECKQGEKSWPLGDLTSVQEDLFPVPTLLGEPRWLFLVIGTGNAPNGKEAYLIPAPDFLEIRKQEYDNKRKSVCYRAGARTRVREARIAFEGYELEWQPNIGWIIPEDHTFWVIKKSVKTPKELTRTEEVSSNDRQTPTPTPIRISFGG
jgi:hypothetical protein